MNLRTNETNDIPFQKANIQLIARKLQIDKF